MAYQVGDNKNLGRKLTKWQEQKANNWARRKSLLTTSNANNITPKPPTKSGGNVGVKSLKESYFNPPFRYTQGITIKDIPFIKDSNKASSSIAGHAQALRMKKREPLETTTANTDFDKRFNSIAGNDRLDRKRGLMSSKAYETKYNKGVKSLKAGSKPFRYTPLTSLLKFFNYITGNEDSAQETIQGIYRPKKIGFTKNK